VSLASCIYEGYVRHRRFQPVVNQFQYRVFLMYMDLAELPTLFQGRWLWSADRVNLAYFRRRDHLGDPRVPLDRAVRDLVADKTGVRPKGPIRLLAHLRYFGYCFNPASFYYCYDEPGARVDAVVVQIHNTPWGEEHCYVLDEARNEYSAPGFKRFQFSKAFHVSPFMPMDVWYDWRVKEPGETLSAHFMNYREGGKIFDATLTLARRELTPRNLTRVLMSHPPMTLKVITLIHWQALRLWLKGARFYVHPRKRQGKGLQPS
jgi:uncharacterized protein